VTSDYYSDQFIILAHQSPVHRPISYSITVGLPLANSGSTLQMQPASDVIRG